VNEMSKLMSEVLALCENGLALWDAKNGSGAIPQLKGAKAFTLVEVNKYTNTFLETNNIGTGGRWITI
nr:probable leucine-rich repeat receptor-like protein kinase At5g49770 [Tanacetum cinerariifolium]